MNLTLSVDEQLVKHARKVAAGMGKSLNQVIRDYLEQLTGRDRVEADLQEFAQLSIDGEGRSRGWDFDRDELHER